MRQGRLGLRGAVAAVALGMMAGAASAQIMIVGNDEKITWDEAGKAIAHEPGHDSVSFVDIAKPDAPKIIATIPSSETIR